MQIDLLSPSSFVGGQPHDQYTWLRRNAPVHWHNERSGRGYWAVTRFQDVWNVDRNYADYSNSPTIMLQDPPDGAGEGSFGPYKMMLMMDPPEHTAFRKLIRGEFTLPAAKLRAERIAELAKQIVD